jgi:phosphatidylinositol 4-kinase
MKESNVNYYLSCLDFYNNLQKLCILLYNYPINAKENEISRDKVLKEFIKYINEDIQTMRKENYISIMKHTNQQYIYNKKRKYNKGYLLPFDNPISNSDKHSYIIVNIIPEYSLCFNTKERVPIKLCCECIEMNECEDFYSLYNDNNFYNTCVKEIEIEIEKEKEYTVENNKNNNDEDDNKSSQSKFNLSSTSFWLSQQISMFNSRKVKIFDKWANLEKYLKNENSFTLINEQIEPFNEQEWIEESNQFNDFVIIGLNLEIINPFGKPLSHLENELKSKSAFSKFKSYTIKQFIAKANDDLKQEMFTMQLIKLFAKAFEGSDIYISTYDILLTSTTSGLVELVPNSSSIHGILKKISDKGWNLETFFRKYYSSNIQQAQLNFANSLAGFCLLSYFLDIKDRHNGNILLDNKGRISHIDFGFVLGLSPKNMHFEKAQFKLTQNYVNILDGFDSELFNHFKKQIVKGIIIARKYYNVFKTLINTMSNANLLCFQYKSKNEIIKTFYLKFMFNKSDKEVQENVNMLIKDSYNNFWTNQYDNFQKIMNGINC